MAFPSNTPGPYAPYDAAPGAPAADANGRHLSYSSSSDTGGSNSATDGYSSATSSGYVEYVPSGYHQGHVQQHGGMAPAQQPYVTHHQQQFHSPPQVHQPGAATYEHTDVYATGIPPQLQHPQQISQQQHHQQSPTSMNAPVPQALPVDAAPDHSHSSGAAGPEHQHQHQHQKQQNSGQQYQRIARFVGPPPVANACTECRARHLKCDAGVPSCGRCLADRRECSYVKSRRGWKGSRRQKVAAAAAAAAAEKEKNQSDDGSDTNGKSNSGKVSLPPNDNFFLGFGLCGLGALNSIIPNQLRVLDLFHFFVFSGVGGFSYPVFLFLFFLVPRGLVFFNYQGSGAPQHVSEVTEAEMRGPNLVRWKPGPRGLDSGRCGGRRPASHTTRTSMTHHTPHFHQPPSRRVRGGRKRKGKENPGTK